MPVITSGSFIVYEGVDGSGQNTQAKFLVEYLKTLGFNVLETYEPTDSYIGTRIRKILNGVITSSDGALGLQMLMVRDRAWHLSNVIQPHLDAGGVVVCVRYLYSTLAYGQADGILYNNLWKLNNDFLRPNLTIFLDLDPEISLDRVKARTEETGQPLDIFEKKEFLIKVRENFLRLLDQFPEMVKIDASGTPNEVHQRILDHLEPLIVKE